MQRIFYLICTFLICSSSLAQTDSAALEKVVNAAVVKDPQIKYFVHASDSLEKVSKYLYKVFLLKVNQKAKENGDIYLEGMCINYQGLWYLNLGLYSDAYNYLNKALQHFEKTNNQKGVLNVYTNMGNLYYYLNQPKKALEYSLKALELNKENFKRPENYFRAVNVYLNLGSMYGVSGNLDLAQNCFFKALEYYKISPEKDTITRAYILNNIADTYFYKGDVENAEKYGLTALGIKLKYGTLNDKADGYKAYATFIEKKKPKEALDMFIKAEKLYDKDPVCDNMKQNYLELSEINERLKNYSEAMRYLKLANKTETYLDSIGKASEIGIKETRNELRKKSVNDSLQNQIQIKVRDVKLVQKKRESYLVILVLVIVSAFAFLFYRRFKLSQKQKAEIEFQKKMVDEKNKEITESINYAKNVQDALMPNAAELSILFPESFVTYLPKDIVAGDFYWWHNFTVNGKQKILIAVADCTGHGVPGAMVSVVCINALNRVVNEFNLLAPNEVLDKVNILVNETFSKNNKHINDGMDISLLLIDHDKMTVNWSGANNRLMYFEKGKLMEIKPDKQSIGKSDVKKPFVVHSIPLIKGTSFYLLSDGFHDQFGGERSKKMGFANFRTLLLDNYEKTMQVQGKNYEEAFKKWKKDLEQTDDVTLIGIKV